MNNYQKKKYCSGCKDNFYNGNNEYGIQECWCLKSAKVVFKKFVPVDMRPPWNMKAVRTLDCHKKKYFVAVDKNVTF